MLDRLIYIATFNVAFAVLTPIFASLWGTR
jgi:hypothetical protein